MTSAAFVRERILIMQHTLNKISITAKSELQRAIQLKKKKLSWINQEIQKTMWFCFNMPFAKRKLIGFLFSQQLIGNFYYSMSDKSFNPLSENTGRFLQRTYRSSSCVSWIHNWITWRTTVAISVQEKHKNMNTSSSLWNIKIVHTLSHHRKWNGSNHANERVIH